MKSAKRFRQPSRQSGSCHQRSGWRIWLRRACLIRCERKATSAFSGTDNVCTVVLPRLCRQYAGGRHQVPFEFLPWQSGIAELVEHGLVDLVLHIDDGLLSSHFQSERLYREDWICAVAGGSRFGDRLSLKQYLAASHIVVATYAGVQTIPDKQLAAVGAKRSS